MNGRIYSGFYRDISWFFATIFGRGSGCRARARQGLPLLTRCDFAGSRRNTIAGCHAAVVVVGPLLFFPVLGRAPFSDGGAEKERLFLGVSDIFPVCFSLFSFFFNTSRGAMAGVRHDENGSGEKGSEGSEAGRGGAGVGQVVDLEVCEAAAEGGDGNEDLDTGFDGVGG